jgi:prepilin-type N-terminal cleavage/methylation domain-containing protein
MQAEPRRRAGFTLVEIMIVVAIIGLLTSIAIPNFVRARTTVQKNACINNLRQLDNAKQQWALENGMTATDAPVDSDLIGTDRYLKRMPQCPANGTYGYNDLTTKATCSVSDHTLN